MDVQQQKGPASAGPVFDNLELAVRLATNSVLVGLVLLVCSEVFLRGVFNYSLGFAEELTGYCVVMLCLFGAALSLRASTLFQVNFLFDRLPDGVRVWVHRAFVVAALIICLILAWKTKDVMLSSFGRGKFAPTVLRTPLWIPQILLPAGFTVIGIFLIEQLLLSGRKFKDES